MEMIKYLSIDPGKTFGWATFDEQGNMVAIGQENEDNLPAWSNEFITDELEAVIVEDYKNMPWKKSTHAWSRNDTSKQIGKIELLCQMRGVKVILQRNVNYAIGAMWGGFEIPKNHSISHQYVAAAHGVFYLQKAGIRKPGQFMRNADESKPE